MGRLACRAVELMAWIRQEHDGLAIRLHDWFVEDVPLDRWRERPGDVGASMAWLVLHTATHQDLAINVAARGEEPVGRFVAALEEHDALDAHPEWDASAILDYADAVHARTASWLADVDARALDDVPPVGDRLDAAGIDVAWIRQRWSGKPVSWFVQWEAIGHTLLHHGEMAALRVRLGLRAG